MLPDLDNAIADLGNMIPDLGTTKWLNSLDADNMNADYGTLITIWVL